MKTNVWLSLDAPVGSGPSTGCSWLQVIDCLPLVDGEGTAASCERAWSGIGKRVGAVRGEAGSFALQQVEGAHVLVQGLDAKAVAALAVDSAALLDGCGCVRPLFPVLRGDQAAALRLVLEKKNEKHDDEMCQSGSNSIKKQQRGFKGGVEVMSSSRSPFC